MRKLTAILCLILFVLGSASCTTSKKSIGEDEVVAYLSNQRGIDAHKRGDYATALREWTPLAKQGDADAQYNLGQMYRRGQGIPQNYKTAAKWYRLAKGKFAISCPTIDDVRASLESVRESVLKGDLDGVLEKKAREIRAKFDK